VRDDALLAGVRSRGDGLFLAAAAGIARVTAFEKFESETRTGAPRTGFAYDFSAHADVDIVGLSLAVSGVVGPRKTSYLVLTLGAEVGSLVR
jgi:hypothetical protein